MVVVAEMVCLGFCLMLSVSVSMVVNVGQQLQVDYSDWDGGGKEGRRDSTRQHLQGLFLRVQSSAFSNSVCERTGDR